MKTIEIFSHLYFVRFLKRRNAIFAEGIAVNLFNEIYPDLPVARKWLSILNTLSNEKAIRNLEWENTNYGAGNLYQSFKTVIL